MAARKARVDLCLRSEDVQYFVSVILALAYEAKYRRGARRRAAICGDSAPNSHYRHQCRSDHQ